ncbi:hypothetical protein CCMA1212_008114 [Trichoderma ghanense]|uniref:Uncharacterized protein n=1 Tax=Trichoderma ghanense TaxID=65468 RepID=A0ABY2GWI9_9HYPO
MTAMATLRLEYPPRTRARRRQMQTALPTMTRLWLDGYFIAGCPFNALQGFCCKTRQSRALERLARHAKSVTGLLAWGLAQAFGPPAHLPAVRQVGSGDVVDKG